MSAEVIIEVAEPWFTALRDGTKKIEGRKGSPKWSALRVGQLVHIASADATAGFPMQVEVINKYPSIRSYLVAEGLSTTLPGVASLEEGVRIYEAFWTNEEVEEHGVLALHLEPPDAGALAHDS